MTPLQDIAQKIGEFFLEQSGKDYEVAEETIRNIWISKIELVDGVVVITAVRVGLLIGKRGETIDALTKYLGLNMKVKIVEDALLGWIMPADPKEHQPEFDLGTFDQREMPEFDSDD